MADMRERRAQSMRMTRGCQALPGGSRTGNPDGMRTDNCCQGMGGTAQEGTSCRRLKRKLQEIDFAIADTVLYLDAYPQCAQALAYYHKLLEERERYLTQVNAACGPMQATQNVSTEHWQWTQGPWPWQAEAN